MAPDLLLLALAYLGLACFARQRERAEAVVAPGDRVPRTGLALAAGTLALLLELVLAIHLLGAAQGIVAAVVAAGVAGILLVLLLSIRPEAALAPTVPLLIVASLRRLPG